MLFCELRQICQIFCLTVFTCKLKEWKSAPKYSLSNVKQLHNMII